MRLAKASTMILFAALALLVSASAALAYPSYAPNSSTDPLRTDCVDCHGRESNEATGTIASPSTHKGPHGAYTAGTSKCKACHSVHRASDGSTMLLPAATVKDTCESCHDGTGGAGVYGVIKARTGVEPAATHSINSTNTIPGGNADGSPRAGTFGGPGNTLTCSDCHSPHDSSTVDVFVGDRLRAEVTSEPVAPISTNRLLKRQPSSTETSVGVYGAGWCATCHRGRGAGHDPATAGLIAQHSLMAVEGQGADEYSYDNLPVVAGADSTQTVMGRLGGSNAGYIMPEGDEGPGSRSELQEGRGPICQQCHEDGRDVGPAERGTNPMLSEEQTFTVNVYAPSESEQPTDNPRFRVFPHESDARAFLVQPYEPEPQAAEDEPSYALCLNCHSLRHEAPEEYAACMVCHDEGDVLDLHAEAPEGCALCHAPGQEPTMDCSTCHEDQLEPHGPVPPLGDYEAGKHTVTLGSKILPVFEKHPDEEPADSVTEIACSLCHSNELGPVHLMVCESCHPAPADSFVEPEQGCQQGGCHPTIHAGVYDAHRESGSNAARCLWCHESEDDSTLRAEFCRSCHAPYDPNDEPVTEVLRPSPQENEYVGPVRFDFRVTMGLKIGIGATFVQPEGGETTRTRSVYVPGVGQHKLFFWSVGQNGQREATRTLEFTVLEDTDAPETTSTVISGNTYTEQQVFALLATDSSFLGVKETNYELRLGGTPVQWGPGTELTVAPPTIGTAEYTLEFWSVDWSGNVEPHKVVTFTMDSG